MEENRNIFQIYLTDEIESNPSPEINECINSIRKNSASLHHFLLNNFELENIISNNLPLEVIQAYRKLAPYSYKADLGRYCLLYLYGGWYFDVSVRVSTPIPSIVGLSHIIFKDAPNPSSQSWDASTSVIYAEKGSQIMLNSIEQIIENCRKESYGVNALCPTGPSVLGRSVALNGPDPHIMHGMLMTLTPKHKLQNNAFVLPDGNILAWGKKTWGTPEGDGLAGLGAKGTNSYALLYHTRNIYHSTTE